MNDPIMLLNLSTLSYKIAGYSYFSYIVFTIIMFITAGENDPVMNIVLTGLCILSVMFLIIIFTGKYLEIKAKQLIKKRLDS